MSEGGEREGDVGGGKNEPEMSDTTRKLLMGGLVLAVAGSVFSMKKTQAAMQKINSRHSERMSEAEALRRQKTMFVANARMAKQMAAKYAASARDITLEMKRLRPHEMSSTINKVDKDKADGPVQRLLNKIEHSGTGFASNSMLQSGEWEFSDDESKASYENKVITKDVAEALGRLGFEFGQVVSEDEARAAWILQSIASEPNMRKFDKDDDDDDGESTEGERKQATEHEKEKQKEEKEAARNKVMEEAHRRLEEVSDAYHYLMGHFYHQKVTIKQS